MSTSQTIAAIAVVAAAVLAGAYLSGHIAEQRPVTSLEDPPASASRAASADPGATVPEDTPDAN